MSNIDPLIFLTKYDEHDAGYLELSKARLPSPFANIEVMNVEIVKIVPGVGLEEIFFIVEAEG